MFKKVINFFIIFCIITTSLFAESYVIRTYDFDIPGKTQTWVIRNLLVPKTEERFSSREELTAALDSKKQLLDNKRVFKSVEYTVREEVIDDTVYVDVLYTIIDARTFLILPYPKYDSNYGLKLGLKYYENNVLGTLSNLYGVLNIVFEPWDFKDAEYSALFSLKDLLLGQTSLSLDFKGQFNPEQKTHEYKTGLSVNNIVLAPGYGLDFQIGVEDTGSDRKYSVGSKVSGLKLKDVSFTPAIAALIYEKEQSESYITPTLSTENIVFGNIRLDLNESVKFVDSSRFKVGEALHKTTLSFVGGALMNYGYISTVKYTLKDYNIELGNELSYKLSDVTTLYLYENIYWDLSKSYFSTYDTGIGISQVIRIGQYISITPTLKEFLTTSFNKGDIMPNFSRYYVISGSTSGNYVNWKGDFREGVSYSLSISEAWSQDFTVRRAKDTIRDRFEIEGFKILWGWLNPSMRIIVNYTNDVSKYGTINGSDEGILGEYLRGVRDKTITGDGRDSNMLIVLGNINIMSKFPLPSIMSKYMNAYLNLFVDYAFTKHGIDTAEANIARNYMGFGIEGIGILKEYPSYPVRLSLGFDAWKLSDYIKGVSSSHDFYEIYFGLDFFF